MQSSDDKFDDKIVVNVDAMLEDLIPEFLENKQENIKSIYDALEKKDYETIRVLGHSMKGAGGGYGFDKITDFGALIEQGAKDKNSDEIKKWIMKLSNYLHRVEVVYI